ncbi:hypothetical protein B0H67DRAFT_601056 [Lasiosphaeris hirsuta]|uniref:Sequence orphan n=1 Tax=Lasiosphaeris hirsuta TaxID=260670 RepID=A0AA40AGP6_9PEZI|nr:hypothetical protein B0H67DRAFT_601056 [Lasiosphaeris hirsuta]
MKDGRLNSLEVPRAPSTLQFDAVKTPPLSASHLPIATPKAKVVTMETTTAGSTKATWNTKNLGLRLGADAVSAASAAVLISPIISIIDRSIMENASGRRTLGDSLRTSLKNLVLRPHHLIFSKPFALIFMLYGGTYFTANAVDTATSTVQNHPVTLVTSGTSKFAASSAANIGLCIYKDQVFARLFGPAGMVPRPVALPTYALFAARDCMTIFASFNVPHLLGPVLTARLGDEVQRYASGQTLAQFAAPAAVQLVSTPVHLLGLDIYNRPAVAGGLAERRAAVRRNWTVSTAARICRIVPAFGVGGVVNHKVRMGLMERLS